MKSQVSVLTVLVACVFSCSVRAAIVVTSGSLHASASAFNNPASAVDNPPDKGLVLPSTSIDADAVAYGIYLDGFSEGKAHSGVSQDVFGVLRIDESTSITNGFDTSTPSYYAHAETSGSLAFTETGFEVLPWSWSSDGFFGEGDLRVRDASTTTILSLGTQTPATTNSGSIALVPGNYTISWNLTAFAHASVGGLSYGRFALVPEPEVTAVLMAALLFGRQRIQRH